MDLVLADDLQQLQQSYSGEEIVRKVRMFFFMLDSKAYTDYQLFLRAWRAYNSTKEGYEEIAERELAQYRETGYVPLQVARCLLPSPRGFPYQRYDPVG